MKKYILVFCLIICSKNTNAQNKIDSFLGTKGIFSKVSPKKIEAKDVLTFDLKVSVLSTAKGGSKAITPVIMYLNTKDGYIGIDKSENPSKAISETNSNLAFLVETMTKQRFYFTTNGQTKTVEKLETNLINTYKNLPIKPANSAVAVAKKFWNNSLNALPYFVDTFGMQKGYVRFIYGFDYPAEGVFKSYLGNYGIGFYNISDATFLCLLSENKHMKMEITKIETVNIVLKTAQFLSKY